MDRALHFDDSGNHAREQQQARICRTHNCGLDAQEHDDFCPKCRDEIDAMRATARRRFVIWGASGGPAAG